MQLELLKGGGGRHYKNNVFRERACRWLVKEMALWMHARPVLAIVKKVALVQRQRGHYDRT